MKQWYQKTASEALGDLSVTTDGLSAEQAAAQLAKNGKNVLAEGKKKSVFMVFLSQFADLLVIILIIAAIISMFSGNLESTIVIFAVITMNAILGTVQHVKAEKSLESLKSLSSPSAKVIRGGQKIEIDGADVVEGDILVLEAGDLVAADGRIIRNFSLQVNESSLTGESTNIDKNDEPIADEVPLGDRANMVYSGSLVTYGRALVAVTGTGMNTEIGKIASLMNAAKEKKTPLQQSLDKFSGRLAVVIMVISVIVFVLSMWQNNWQPTAIVDSLMYAVALAVAAIPEALGSIVTIVQAMGTQKMAKENAVIKDLKAVESLGCVSVICSDKTGTLTQNKMTVQQVFINGESIDSADLDIADPAHRYLIYNMVLNNDSSIVDGKGIGDPTEFCLLEAVRGVGIDDDSIRTDVSRVEDGERTLDDTIIRDTFNRLEEVPFDSDRKMMSTKYKLHGVTHVLTKGALDSILDRCVSISTSDGVRPITDADKKIILKQNNDYSEQGLRVLTFAYKESDEALSTDTEQGFVFLGLVSMIDPPREESRGAVADAIRAGIKPIMITGDHKVTASAIARQIGIMREGDIAVTGMELDAMTDEALDKVLEKISVYARVSPENKIRIVEAWQRRGNIVSMTGDGVNDAPALKKADIGVAMGITGTEVSKDAASMILQDDNFATIIKAVANGRNVYRNIKNAILFLLSGNLAAIITVLFASFAGMPVPFAPVHLLFINLLTDSLPAIAIGMEKPEPGLLSQKPRSPKEGILTKSFSLLLVGQGVLIALSVIAAFLLGLNGKPAENAAIASTMAFATLTLARLFHGFNCRSEHSIFKIRFGSNLYSLGAFAVGVLLLAAVIFIPALHSPFCVANLSAQQLLIILGLAFAPTFIVQTVKGIRDAVKK